MNIINFTENEIKIIDDFIDCLSSCFYGFNDKYYESADIPSLEKIISTLEKHGIKSGKFYNKIKSILDRKKEEEEKRKKEEEEKRKKEEKENEDKKKSNINLSELSSEIEDECEDKKRKIQSKTIVQFDI